MNENTARNKLEVENERLRETLRELAETIWTYETGSAGFVSDAEYHDLLLSLATSAAAVLSEQQA